MRSTTLTNAYLTESGRSRPSALCKYSLETQCSKVVFAVVLGVCFACDLRHQMTSNLTCPFFSYSLRALHTPPSPHPHNLACPWPWPSSLAPGKMSGVVRIPQVTPWPVRTWRLLCPALSHRFISPPKSPATSLPC